MGDVVIVLLFTSCSFRFIRVDPACAVNPSLALRPRVSDAANAIARVVGARSRLRACYALPRLPVTRSRDSAESLVQALPGRTDARSGTAATARCAAGDHARAGSPKRSINAGVRKWVISSIRSPLSVRTVTPCGAYTPELSSSYAPTAN